MAKNKKKRIKGKEVQTDAQGQFVWETYFVGGKQKRRKVRLIDGQPVKDLDEYLLRNADDIWLHQEGRWDLIEQRRLEEEQTPSEGEAPHPHPQIVPLDIDALEEALDYIKSEFPGSVFGDEPTYIFLDRTSGKLVWVEGEDEGEERSQDANLLELPDNLFEGRDYAHMEDFIFSLEDEEMREKLDRAIRGRGAFRRFRDIVFGGGGVELRYAWDWFETRRKRELIVKWLDSLGIEPRWNRDIFAPPALPDKRADLLRAVLQFVRDARGIPGVRRIALLGSLTTDKAIPKDVDLLVEVDDDAPLNPLARVRRQLSGRTMQTGDCCGADVFVCNPRGDYLGRICQWKECAPGCRSSCPARHCGLREYLCDDLHEVKLDRALVEAPPLDLWPEWIERRELPADIKTELDELNAAGPIRERPG